VSNGIVEEKLKGSNCS